MTRSRPIARAGEKLERHGLLWVKSLRSVLARRPPDQLKQVVFIAGVQRSGTNMMVDILERSLATEVFREIDPRAYDDFELRPLETLRDLVGATGMHTVVFKSLCELQDLRRLLDSMPNAKAIWMLRRMEDMVNSHCHAAFKAGRQRLCGARMTNIAADPLSEGWRGRGMSAETLDLLRRHCHAGLTHESAVALFWLMRNRLFFEQALERDPRLRVVTYEDFVSRPLEHGAALFRWLGLEPSRHVFRKVTPRSVRRWPAPAIDPPVRALCDELYQRFRREATLLEREVGTAAEPACESMAPS